MHKVCQTVAFAHSKGVVHRDLKPENIMVGPFGEAYVMDWGLALLLGSNERGGIVGTPAYMAPEQAAGRSDEIGPCSDVYSLGAILYELLTGGMPHELSLALERTTTFEEVLAAPNSRWLEPVSRALAQPSDVAAEVLARKMLDNAKSGAHLRAVGPLRALGLLLSAPFRPRAVLARKA